MFLQFHTLTSYPGTLLNRDDAGFAKRLPFGGATRTRVSSQCLKYHWRNFDGEHALYGIDDVEESLRSRETFRRRVAQPLVDDGHPAPLVRAATASLKELIVSGSTANKSTVKDAITAESDDEISDALDTNQVTIFGAPEMRYLRSLAEEVIESVEDDFPVFWESDGVPDSDAVGDVADAIRKSDLIKSRKVKKNLKGLNLASGLDAALFGRMATSDVLARGDAAIHVAHAFTTHKEESESDYFSAVDELRRDQPEESGEMGAGHINSQELTSGLFYNYVVIDVPLLVSNLEGCERDDWSDADRTLASEVVHRFVHLMTRVSPGAKLGSTAPYAYAQCLIAEAGMAQPRTMANAFQEPVSKEGNVLENSYDALASYVDDLNGMYGRTAEAKLSATNDSSVLQGALGLDDTTPVPEIAEWAADTVTEAR
jgi:CRISPR system Cascade subunit CasC